MRAQVVDGVGTESVAVAVVWIPMLPADDDAAAREASRLFDGADVRQFFDARRLAGRAIAASVGATGEIAWDVYLAYGRDASWAASGAPAPVAFAHQLGGSWADQSRYCTGERLREELGVMVRGVV